MCLLGHVAYAAHGSSLRSYMCLAQCQCSRLSICFILRRTGPDLAGVLHAVGLLLFRTHTCVACSRAVSLSHPHVCCTQSGCFPFAPICVSYAVGLFPFRTHMVSKMKMGYIEVETGAECNIFPANSHIRGQVYHFSEILRETIVGGWDHDSNDAVVPTCYQATKQVRCSSCTSDVP